MRDSPTGGRRRRTYNRTRTKASTYAHQQSARPCRIVHDNGCTAVHPRRYGIPTVNGDFARALC
jgi:hypothetical protein